MKKVAIWRQRLKISVRDSIIKIERERREYEKNKYLSSAAPT